MAYDPFSRLARPRASSLDEFFSEGELAEIESQHASEVPATELRGNGQAARPGKATPRKPMAIEWFSEAADSALDEPINPLIEDLLDEGALSVIYGDSGSGKTFCALDMGFHVGAGLDWNGKKVTRGLVVYVAAEGGKRIKRRIAALKKRYHEEHGKDAPLSRAYIC